MDAEIVITGLCSILNPEGKNSTMGDPSFIAVRTSHEHVPVQPSDHHITYLAFDSTIVQVDDAVGFLPVEMSEDFQYLALDGCEIRVADNPPGTPVVDQTYRDLVVRKDNYWPEAKNEWNRDYVALAGSRPKKSAVRAFMRFGAGTISAGRVSGVVWQFPRHGSSTYSGNFAEEVVYRSFPHGEDEVVVELRDLDADSDGEPFRTLRFSLLQQGGPLTLFIGNSVESDMAGSVERIPTKISKVGNHFKYMNKVADSRYGDGPIPVPVNPEDDGTLGGGENSGPCGPGSGND